MQNKNRQKKPNNGSIQRKMTVMTISLTVIAVVLFLLIVSLRLFLVRGEIRMTGEEASEEILKNSEIAYTMSNVVHFEELVGDNADLINERFGFANYMLKCLRAQILSIAAPGGSDQQIDISSPSSDDSQIMAAAVTPFINEIIDDDPEAPDCIVIAFPNGESIVVTPSSGNKNGASGNKLSFDARGEEWYSDAVKNKESFTVSKSHLPGKDTECITVSTPVCDTETGDLVCVLGASVASDTILNIIEKDFNEEGLYPVLIDETGTILFSTISDGPFAEADLLNKKENAGNEFIQFIIDFSTSGYNSSIEITIDGAQYYCAFSSVLNAGLGELVFAEKDLFVADTNQLVDDLEMLTERTVDVSDRNFSEVLTQMLILSVVLIGLSILASVLLSRRIAGPIKSMTGKVAEIDGEKILFEMEEIFRTGDEIETLAVAFEAMSQKIRQYITDIVEISTQKERMETELKVANEIQSAMLPKNFPLFPDRTEFDVYASMDPAREVGGDFYDIFMTDDDHLALVVGDASEKGVPAALFMVISKAYIRTRALTGGSPGEILTDVNNLLAEGNGKKMFVTVWLAILEISTGRLIYANAGHEKAVIKRADEDYVLDHTKHGFILGGIKGVSYSDNEITLKHGDRIFMYTDGLTEAHKNVEDLFGSARMLEVLNKNSTLPPDELLSAVKAKVDEFVGDEPQFDDMTMLALEYK